MKYLPLILAGLLRKKTRTVLTLISIAIAFVLFGLLQALHIAFNRGVEISGEDRLVTQGRYSLTEVLPISYLERIRQTPGVKLVTHAQWFGGVYQDPSNFIAQFAVDPDTYFDMYSEYLVAPEQKAAFRANRIGAIAGKSLAERFGWRVGDRIPIQATIWPKADGSNDWEFELVGTFAGRDEATRSQEGTLLFRWDYFDEARAFERGTTGIYIARVEDPARLAAVAAEIDRGFRNSGHETKSGSEKAFNASFIAQLGDIGLIVTAILSAVFFTILLVTANTMAQSVRERIPEIAILKTLGFDDRTALALVLCEALALCALGALIGMGVVAAIIGPVGKAVESFMPGIGITGWTWAQAFAIATALAFATGMMPAWKAKRLRIVEALGGHA